MPRSGVSRNSFPMMSIRYFLQKNLSKNLRFLLLMQRTFGVVKFHSPRKIKGASSLNPSEKRQKTELLKLFLSWSIPRFLLANPYLKSWKSRKKTRRRKKRTARRKILLQQGLSERKEGENLWTLFVLISDFQNRRKYTKISFLSKKLNLKKAAAGPKRKGNQGTSEIYCNDSYRV